MSQSETVNQVRRNTIISTMSLFFQSGYSAGLGLAANLVLTIHLSRASFGIYGTVLSIISILNYFSDIGLAASLIQKKDISNDDVKTTFSVQQLMVITIIVLCFTITPFVKNWYNLPDEGIHLYWALLLSFFLSSLKTIPSVFLERKIEFQKIVTVQIIENTFFYFSVMIFALLGFSLESFTIAVLLRAIIGVIAMYRISFWKPEIGISLSSLKQLLSFGVPFQLSSFLALFKDDLITIFLAKIVGFDTLGSILWAKKWAEAPIRIVMDNITRVLFPLIARFQHNKEKVGLLTDKLLTYQTALIAPAIVGMALIMSEVVEVLPKYSKWESALPLFYIFCFSSFIVSLCAPFVNIFNALGKAKLTFIYMLIWTIIIWIFTPFLTFYTGSIGFPLAHMIVSISYFIILIQAKKYFHFHFLKSIYPFIISALLMLISVFILRRSVSFSGIPAIIFMIGAGSTIYFFSVTYIFKISFFQIVQSILHKNTN
ncbi:MAG: oligosaccharide flippase family protein [Candidatus Roizmanbacteria bacterium]